MYILKVPRDQISVSSAFDESPHDDSRRRVHLVGGDDRVVAALALLHDHRDGRRRHVRAHLARRQHDFNGAQQGRVCVSFI